MSPSDRIGFIGLGSMGVHMATNLQKTLAKSNRKLVVWNRTISKAESMKDTGVEIASSAEDVVDKADIIFVSMSKDEASLDLFEKLYAVHESGKGRKLTAEQPLIFLDTTTLYPTVGRDLEQRAEKVPNRYYLSMPVFGAPPAAAAAQLIVVTAGKELVKKKIEPYLVNVIGRVIIDCGTDIQKGFELKLVGNFFISGVVELLAEGMTLADKSGLTQEKLMEFINLMFPAVPFKGYGTKMLEDKFTENVGFTCELAMKDNRHIRKIAETHNVSMPTADTVYRHLQTSRAYGGADYDWSALSSAVRVQAGLPPFKKDPAVVKKHLDDLQKRGII